MKVTIENDHIDTEEIAAIHSLEPQAIGVREGCVIYLKGGASLLVDPYLGRLVLEVWGKGSVDLVHREHHRRKQ